MTCGEYPALSHVWNELCAGSSTSLHFTSVKWTILNISQQMSVMCLCKEELSCCPTCFVHAVYLYEALAILRIENHNCLIATMTMLYPCLFAHFNIISCISHLKSRCVFAFISFIDGHHKYKRCLLCLNAAACFVVSQISVETFNCNKVCTKTAAYLWR